MPKETYVIRLNPERKQENRPWKGIYILLLATMVKPFHLAAFYALAIESSYYMGDIGKAKRENLFK